MIEISIRSELAADHPRFMAECLERGRHVTVFASVEKPRPIGEARQPWPNTVEVAEQDRWVWPGRAGQQ